jgi:murein DD-endopeptidase MepM/ murein hydrolase activator NlpD
MNIFLLVSSKKGPKSLDVTTSRFLLPLTMLLLAVSAILISAGFMLGQYSSDSSRQSGINQWYSSLQQNREDIQRVSQEATDDINALALRLGQMEARSIRLDALGSRLVDVAGLEAEEFDFVEAPAVGGPADSYPHSNNLKGLLERFTDLQRQIDDRAQKFQLLESIFMDRELEKQVLPNGRPVTKGWMSSKFGRRADPFTGKSTWHAGVDFAGKYGSDIVAVAAGVVKLSGRKSGFGEVVEISHGNGFVTRYAHNSKNLVQAGDMVEKGEVIAKMGSTGRSTGSHVHFEVVADRKLVNPARYIQNASVR